MKRDGLDHQARFPAQERSQGPSAPGRDIRLLYQVPTLRIYVFLKIFSMGRPFASSSMSLSR